MEQDYSDYQLSENELAVLGVLFSVDLNPKDSDTDEYIIGENRVKLNEEGIFSVSKHRIGEDRDTLTSILESLLEKKMVDIDNSSYSLTDSGKKIGKKIRTKWVREFYDNTLLRCAKSKAYAKFCELAHGKNLLQFNVVDMEQLNLLLENLKIDSKDLVLDLGCGLGKITEYLASKTGADFTGIDFAEKCIQWAKNNTKGNGNLKFDLMDITELTFPTNSFDVIIALDVLYWIDDLKPVIKKIKDILKPDGRMGFFYVQFKKEDEPNESMQPENTIIAKLLAQNSFSFEVIDVSQIAIDIWKTKIAVGEKLRDQFVSEGNQDILDQRMTDGVEVIKKFETNQQKRYFFSIENK